MTTRRQEIASRAYAESLRRAYRAGFHAADEGKSVADCPYRRHEHRRCWLDGHARRCGELYRSGMRGRSK